MAVSLRSRVNLTRGLLIATVLGALVALGTWRRGEVIAPVVWTAVSLALAAATALTMRANLTERGSLLADRADRPDDGWMTEIDRRADRRAHR